nr:LysM peptidoglycan-binding domain-containing protein [Anaerolineae bacterium]
MKHQHIHWMILAALALLLGPALPGLQAAPAAQVNLLVNPGFEDPYVPFEGDTTRMVASGWSAWHVPQREGDEGFRNLKPEYQPANATNPDRVLQGINAQEYFSFFATHTGGVFQQVVVPTGAAVEFSAFVYVWSTRGDDRDLSEDPGRAQIQVGIDPNGGTDGESERIIWSLPLEYYDEYRQVAVSAENVSNRITVFVRTTFDLPQKNNNIYVDNAALVVTSSPEPTSTVTPLPSPTVTPTAIPPSATPEPDATATSVPSTTIAPPTVVPGDSEMPTPTQEVESTEEPTAQPSVTPASGEFPYQIVYTVVAGDTVYELARTFDSSVEAILQANGLNAEGLIFIDQELVIPVRTQPEPSPTPTLDPTSIGIIPTATPVGILPTGVPPAQPTAPPLTSSGFFNYTVVQGDTLTRIASRYNTSVQVLVQLNGIVNPNLISIGQQLRVPGEAQPTPAPQPEPQRPGTHVVQPGENLYRISLRYGVSLQQLAQANGIANMNWIFVGQVLNLP